MGYIKAIRSIDRMDIVRTLIIIFPYADQALFGIIPGIKSMYPGPELHPSEWGLIEWLRWLILLLLPYVDGEIVEVVSGGDANAKTIIRD